MTPIKILRFFAEFDKLVLKFREKKRGTNREHTSKEEEIYKENCSTRKQDLLRSFNN